MVTDSDKSERSVGINVGIGFEPVPGSSNGDHKPTTNGDHKPTKERSCCCSGSSSSATEVGAVSTASPKADLVQLLLQPEYSAVIEMEAIVKPKDYINLAGALVQLADTFGQAPFLINKLIDHDIQNTLSDDIILRSESLAIKTMSTYLQLCAQQYVKHIMTPFFELLARTELSYEIDPERLDDVPKGEREQVVANNATNLAELCAGLLDAIEKAEFEDTEQRAPWQLRSIMSNAFHAAGDKFPGSEVKAANGILFLRLLTPIILGAQAKELGAAVPKEKKRLRMLLAKLVQNIANSVSDFKEDSMMPMNMFVTERIERNQKLMEFMCVKSEPPVGTPRMLSPASVGRTEMDQSAAKLLEFLLEQEDLFILNEVKGDAIGLGGADVHNELVTAIMQAVEAEKCGQQAKPNGAGAGCCCCSIM